MKEFSFEEAQKVLGTCALASIDLISEKGVSAGSGVIWKSLADKYWVRAEENPEVAYGCLGPERPNGNGYYGH